jgi:hypothetical protein
VSREGEQRGCGYSGTLASLLVVLGQLEWVVYGLEGRLQVPDTHFAHLPPNASQSGRTVLTRLEDERETINKIY